MSVKTLLRLDDDVDEALRRYCRERGAVMARVTNLALREWLELGPPRRAEAQHPPDDPDVEFVRLIQDTFDAREVDPGT